MSAFAEVGALAVEGQGPFAPEVLAPGPDAVYSRRFQAQHADDTWTVATFYAGVVWASDELAERLEDEESDERGEYLDHEGVAIRAFAVDETCEIVRCTDPADPGSSEVGSDYESGEGSYLAFTTYADARAEARRLVAILSVDVLGEVS